MTATAEVWLAVSYAAFLLAASNGLAWLARRTERGPRHPWDRSPGQGKPSLDGEAPWPHSDAARFERGLSRVLVVLAFFILAVTAARHPAAAPIPIGTLVLVVAIARRSWLARGPR